MDKYQAQQKPSFLDSLLQVADYKMRKEQADRNYELGSKQLKQSEAVNKFNIEDKVQTRRDVAGTTKASFILKLKEFENNATDADRREGEKRYKAYLVKEAISRKIMPSDLDGINALDKELEEKGVKQRFRDETNANRLQFKSLSDSLAPIVGNLNRTEEGQDEFSSFVDAILNGGF